MNRVYRVLHFICYPFFWLLFPFTVHGLENVPADHPVVLCANHSHAVDPFLIGLSLPRTVPLRIMGKKELFDKPLLGALLTALGAFPVDRGHSDLSAVKTAIRAIRDGAHLLVFPEGTRVRHEGEARPKGGVVMIAMRAGAPLLPVYVGKPDKLFRMTHIVFGKPYEPKSESRRAAAEEYEAFAEEVMRRAYALGREWKKR